LPHTEPPGAFAQILGLNQAVSLLEKTLEEEKKADMKLTNLAEGLINEEALRGAAVSQQ
jgi:ferritin-like metal-binding protein YciE